MRIYRKGVFWTPDGVELPTGNRWFYFGSVWNEEKVLWGLDYPDPEGLLRKVKLGVVPEDCSEQTALEWCL